MNVLGTCEYLHKWWGSTVLSRKYHATVFNTHVRLEARKSAKKVLCKFAIDRDCGVPTLPERYIEDRTALEMYVISPAMRQIYWFFILRLIYEQIMSICPCIYVIWYGFIIYCRRMTWFYQYMAAYCTGCPRQSSIGFGFTLTSHTNQGSAEARTRNSNMSYILRNPEIWVKFKKKSVLYFRDKRCIVYINWSTYSKSDFLWVQNTWYFRD